MEGGVELALFHRARLVPFRVREAWQTARVSHTERERRRVRTVSIQSGAIVAFRSPHDDFEALWEARLEKGLLSEEIQELYGGDTLEWLNSEGVELTCEEAALSSNRTRTRTLA